MTWSKTVVFATAALFSMAVAAHPVVAEEKADRDSGMDSQHSNKGGAERGGDRAQEMAGKHKKDGDHKDGDKDKKDHPHDGDHKKKHDKDKD